MMNDVGMVRLVIGNLISVAQIICLTISCCASTRRRVYLYQFLLRVHQTQSISVSADGNDALRGGHHLFRGLVGALDAADCHLPELADHGR